ncbi:MAG: preprotein translocase subunit YajC [bacterium]
MLKVFIATVTAMLVSVTAFAQSATAPMGLGGLTDKRNLPSLVMMVGFIVIFYFLLIRPQRQQMKARQALLASLKVGDKVITTGGIYGEITDIKEKSVRVKIAKDVILRMDRSGIQSKTTKDE